MFGSSEEITGKPQVFSIYTADDLRTHEYTSSPIPAPDISSRNKAFIDHAYTRKAYNRLQYFGPDQLRKEVHQSGFGITVLSGNVKDGFFEPDHDEFAIIANHA